MEKEVVITQSLDAKQIKTATKSILISSGKKIWIYAIIIGIVVLTNLITSQDNKPESHEESNEVMTSEVMTKDMWVDVLISILPVIAFAVIFISVLNYLKAKNTKAQLKKKARYFTNVTYTINNAFFKKQGEGFNVTHYWEEIYRIKETAKFYLIFSEKLQAHVIDKAQLDPWQLEEIKEIFDSLKSKVKVSLK
nr:YcxB family protein [uncultured Flavobacterium sp.]